MSKEEAAVIDFDESMKTGEVTEAKVDEEVVDPPDVQEEQEEEEEESEEAKEKEQEEEEEKEKEEDKEKDEPESKKSEDDSVSVDDFVKQEYAEKYEIESKKDLDELLEVANHAILENKKLKEQIEKSKDTKPQFTSEHEQKAFEFIKDFSRLDEGMQSLAGLLAMDVEKTDAKLVLEAQYIMDNPELSRDKAKAKFERIYAKKYGVKAPEDYESEKDYNDAKEDADLELEIDSERARKALKIKQAELKSAKREAPSGEPQLTESVKTSIERHAGELQEYSEGFSELIFSPTEDSTDDFTFKLSKEQLKAVRSAAENWVKNPASYDEKGQFKAGKFDPEEVLVRTVYAMFGQELFTHMVDHMHTLANIKRAEDIGKKKPTDKSKGKGDPGNLDEYAQAEHLIKKRQAQGRMSVH